MNTIIGVREQAYAYITSIKNKSKRQYAEEYFETVLTEDADAIREKYQDLNAMMRQAVEIRIENILGV